ncbi:ADP-ribosylglycohydrolase family protein [Saccharopolyspora sp. WRP15-2]|uniref:ADP-ribosylglycohydrolase family protein n=1 Tax=Saccharopolyspora oryzae TaxID=2997343 RepID=A0ABT4UTF3_9PSEU|nr:ADP-ribosylglycohydrolase family protein [Saccharopolyspora oryzae]MDA3625000.1 ADP-ribosylglycohydrolase family protein [Saccharopolyspora oryzae]
MTDARPPQLSWAERFRGAMLGGAVGDALGAGVRNRSTSEIQQWFGPQGVVDYLPVYGRRGAVTDLTQLSVFTLEALLRAKAARSGSGWLPTEFIFTNYLRWLYTQGVPWDYAMSAYLSTEPAPNSWLLERPELYSTRNPGGTGLLVIGRTAEQSPLGADGTLRPPMKLDGSAEFTVWAAPAMAWSNVPEEVYSVGAAAANLLTSGPNSIAAAGLHSDVLAQLVRGVPLWDAVSTSDHHRLGNAYWTGKVPADVRRTVHAAMFVGQRGVRPNPRDLDVEFDLDEKPGELGIALAAVGSTRNFADAVRVAVNQSGDSSATGALAGQLAGAIYGPGGIPAQWLDELELRQIIDTLCADAAEAFAPPPPPQWAQRYVPNSRSFGGPRELTGPNTVEGAAEQTMVLPAVPAADDTPPQGQPSRRSTNIGAPTFPSSAKSDLSSTGPIPVPSLRSAEVPAETTAVFPAIRDEEPLADAPQIGAFPPPSEPRIVEPEDAGIVVPEIVEADPAEFVESEEAVVDREVAERIVREAADLDRTPAPEFAVDEEEAVADEPEEAAVDREVAERIVREASDRGRISVPDANAVAAGADLTTDTEPEQIQDDGAPSEEPEPLIVVPDADAVAAGSGLTADELEDPEDAGEAAPETSSDLLEGVADEEVPTPAVEEAPVVPEDLPEREPVGVKTPARAPIDLAPAGHDLAAELDEDTDEPETAVEQVVPMPLADVEDDAEVESAVVPDDTADVEEEDVVADDAAAEPGESEPVAAMSLVSAADEPVEHEGAESDAPVVDHIPTRKVIRLAAPVEAEPADEEPDTGQPESEQDTPEPTPAVRPRGGHRKADGPDDSAPSLTERVLGSFLGGALGDSLGSDLEFITAEAITARFGADGPSGLREAYGVRGAITDDTQMTLFTAEGLIRGSIANRMLGSEDPLPEVQLAYQRWLHTQGVDWDAAAGPFASDYPAPDGWLVEVPGLFATRAPGKTVWRALARFGDGHPAGSLTERINDSKGCGGAMRAAPVALWSADPAEVFRLAARTAALTHSHPAGYHSAGALAVIVQQALLGRGLDDGVWLALQVLETWEDHEETSAALKAAVQLAEAGTPTPQQVAEQLGGGWVGEEALAIAVCAALVGGDDVEQALRIAVHHDGDSDSTGAICGNIVGALHGVAALPVDWLADLELRDVVEQIALDCVAEFGHGAFQPAQAAIEPPTGEDWNERYPVRPHWSATPEPAVAAPGPDFPAPKPAPRRINGVAHEELPEGEDE